MCALFLCRELTVFGCLIIPLGEGEQQVLIRARKGSEGVQIERCYDVLFVPMRGAIRTPGLLSRSLSFVPTV